MTRSWESRIRGWVAAALVVATLAASAGCAAITYRRSQPRPSPDLKKLRYGRAVMETVSGTDLSVAVNNRAIMAFWLLFVPIPLAGWSPIGSRLEVWLDIRPGLANARFDPSLVRVVNARGDTLAPMRWFGPGASVVVREYLPVLDGFGECHCVLPRDWAQPDWNAPVQERLVRADTSFTAMGRHRGAPGGIAGERELQLSSCFVLIFDGRRAGHDFTLLPGGIGVGGETLDAPPIRYGKGLDGRYFILPIVIP